MAAGTRILVIKHGALGDVVLATGPMKAIRAHHPGARITLLTTAPYARLLKQSPYFDEIWIDTKPKGWQFWKWLKLAHTLRSGEFTRVYDLQTSTRSTLYYKLFWPEYPEWSGTAHGCSHNCITPERLSLHTADRQKQQMTIAGLTDVPPADISWLKADIEHYLLPAPYALVVPGGAAHRPEKRWPATHYIEAVKWLADKGVTPVLIGTSAEAGMLEEIAAACPEVRNLCNQTSFDELATLARGAKVALGNDTGPMHLIAASDCPSAVLFSHASDPALCAPRGRKVRVLRTKTLDELEVPTVLSTLDALLQ